MEIWKDRACRQGLERRLLQNATRRPRSSNVGRYGRGLRCCESRASKINGRGYSAYQRVIGRNPPQMEDAILDCGGADLGVTGRQQDRELDARKVGDNDTYFTSSKLGPGLQASLETHNMPLSITRASYTLDNHLVLETRSKCSQETDELFLARWSGQQIWPPPQICCQCARSQVRLFHEDDGAAQEHVTEPLKKLGERLLHDSCFTYEDITGHDEPPVDSPPNKRHRNIAT